MDLPTCHDKAQQSETSDNRRGSHTIGCVYRVRCNRRHHQKKRYLAVVSQAGHAIGNEAKDGFGLILNSASRELWWDYFFKNVMDGLQILNQRELL